MEAYHILLVEDEPVVRGFIADRLKKEGYRVSLAESVRTAEYLLQSEQPDLILLDILLPDGSGLEFCRNLRGITGVPLLFVTCLGEKSQIVQGLRAGADDYIVKPFDIEELIARIEALLRRTERLYSDKTRLSVGKLRLFPDERRAKWDGRDLTLSPKEYQILSVLCRNRNRFTPAEELYSEIWGMSAQEDVRTVKVHISGLRRKLRQTTGEDALELEHQKNRGYRLITGGQR